MINLNDNFSDKQKTLSVCIIGKPNAGKSSLLNKIIDQKISIVTPKVQTTRSIITGIVTKGDVQLILFDTPGIFKASKRLEKAMVRCAFSSLHSADIVLLLIDISQKLDDELLDIFKKLKAMNIKPIFVFNKIDIRDKLGCPNEINTYFDLPLIFKISAKKGDGIEKLIGHLCKIAPKSPWLYEKDDVTTSPMRFLSSEITREQLFFKLDAELPYNLTVETENWREQNGAVYINQVIVVSKESYKMIILGKNGSKIKEIGSVARTEMEKAFECKVHLFLFVKVRKLWENMQEFYDYMGLKI